MKSNYHCIFICLLIFLVLTQNSSGKDDGLKMMIPAGQASCQIFRIFVPDISLSKEMNPKLTFLNSKGTKIIELTPAIYPNQTWNENIDSTVISYSGTLLLFSLDKLKISPFKSCIRVYPILEWSEKSGKSEQTEASIIKNSIVYPKCIFIGNRAGAAIYTAALFCFFIGLLCWLTRKDDKGILGLISMNNGQVSMSLTQMALWTIAVGLMVVAFGLLRLDVPSIPPSLLLLMLFASGTSMYGHWQAKKIDSLNRQLKVNKRSDKVHSTEATGTPKLYTLFQVSMETKDTSLAKAQIFFWTLITIAIFIYKSILEGELWDVPIELIGLMGISQGTFLARNKVEQEKLKLEIKEKS